MSRQSRSLRLAVAFVTGNVYALNLLPAAHSTQDTKHCTSTVSDIYFLACCREDEALADMNALNREYENDNSWEQLQEDEHGHLRPLVSLSDMLPC